MLPSCGHFKNIPCPFYKTAICVRPHCPYKHQNTESSQQRQFSSLVDETEVLFASKVDITPKSYNGGSERRQDGASYIPTPVDFIPKPPGILKSSKNVEVPSSHVPEYRPTPISQLKEVTTVPVKASKSIYTPEFPVAVKKRKNIEEYDPAEVKCIPKKSVTFVGETDGPTDAPVILISSEDELDDSENAPKFSDDDFEEELPPTSNFITKVPDVVTIKEDEDAEEVKVDEFSVVDKILVDCKKNERFLNSYKKLPSKTNKSSKGQKSITNKTDISIKTEGVEFKNGNTDRIAEIYPFCSNDIDSISISESKLKKDEESVKSFSKLRTIDNSLKTKSYENSSKVKGDHKSSKVKSSDSSSKVKTSDSSSKVKSSDNSSKAKCNDSSSKVKNNDSSSKFKSSDNIKKEHKSEKRHEKEKKNSSHSSYSKEKLKKNTKETDKSEYIIKKVEIKKTSSTDNNRSIKSNRHSSSESSDRKDAKKKTENNCVKKANDSSTFSAKMNKHSHKHSELHNAKSKDRNFSNEHSLKRKKEAADFDTNHHSSKSKSSPKAKKAKSDFAGTLIKFSVCDRNEPVVDCNNSDSDLDDAGLAALLSSSDSDADPDEECRRIFEEYEESLSSNPKKKKPIKSPTSPDTSELVVMRKKRYAHPAAAELKPPPKQAKEEIKKPLNPGQVMHNRFVQMQAKFAQSNENKSSCLKVDAPKFSVFGYPMHHEPQGIYGKKMGSDKSTDKKRISFAPNQSLLAAVKSKNQGNFAVENFSPLPSTVSKTLKVTQRTAHVPEVAKNPRPIIPADFGSKVPANIRQKFLNAFIDECLKFCSSEDEAFELALEEEKKVYDRSSSKTLYLNVAANGLNRLRRQAEEGPKTLGNSSVSGKNASNQKTVSHQTVLNGPLAQRRSFSIGKKKEAVEIKGGVELYEYLSQYLLTPEQLKENSYPFPHPTEKDRAVIEGIYTTKHLFCNDAFKRMCSRCHKTYYVNVDGDYVRDEECDFHWGRLFRRKIAGNFESRYSCCQGDAESDGCCVSAGHVFDGSENHVLKGYVKTLPKTPPRDKFYGIYALDCEMCYTTAGIELTRLTVVDSEMKTVYETFVKPLHKVLDHNTRFSGITEDDLKNVRTTLTDIQAVLLMLFNDKTILIGHSLESDLKALKLFHSTVVDTSVVFPHRNGPPFKRALRTLSAEMLNKIIQNDVGGHDSHEDAVACMELMLLKVKEDAKFNR